MLSIVDGDYFVASGSLARGMPADFYASVARLVKARGGRMVLDSSGTALHHALREGVFLVKPSRRELEHLLGRKAATPADEEALAREVVDAGSAEIVALTLGAQGAVLATREGVLRHRRARRSRAAAPSVPATPSWVRWSGPLPTAAAIDDAFAYGVAAGAATAMTPGTEQGSREDIERLVPDLGH